MLRALATLTIACSAPAWNWLESQPISHYRPTLERCQAAGGASELLATRRFRRGGHAYLLAVDPKTVATQVLPAECAVCTKVTAADLPELKATPYLRTVEAATAKEDLLQNAGLQHATRVVSGYFLTVDLCPSRKPGFDQAIFDALEHLKQRETPDPVAVSISGSWLTHHRAEFEWLKSQDREGHLRITWVNHTLTHPYDPKLPTAHNFLLERGVHLDQEIFGMEKLLLENGVIPSVFFRFPGLVSSPALIEKLRNYLLVPLGSDAWLAKNEEPTVGSVILIHGNENEEAGVQLFLKWLEKPGNNPEFLDLREALAP